MQKKLLVVVLGSLFAMPVLAADAPAPAVTYNIGLTTNYLYRGITQTAASPALQGGLDYAHASGFYAGAWASSIKWIKEANSGNSVPVEIDTYLGFKNSFATDFSYDVGFLRYNYPGTYATGQVKADTNEIYGLIGYKWLTAKYSSALGDTFQVPSASGTSYLDISASYTVADIALGAHYGKQTYKGSAADAYKTAGTDPTYTDYKLSASKDFSGNVIGLSYTSTNAKKGGFYTVNGKDLGKAALALSLTRSF
jgi:uncharacterized protein (TIGR02001 family)